MNNMEDLFSNPFIVIPAVYLFLTIMVLLLFVYLPRADEIARLRRIIDEQHARIDQLSKDGTAAEIAHNEEVKRIKGEMLADIGDLTFELAASNGRAAQNANRAKTIARAKDEARRGAA